MSIERLWFCFGLLVIGAFLFGLIYSMFHYADVERRENAIARVKMLDGEVIEVQVKAYHNRTHHVVIYAEDGKIYKTGWENVVFLGNRGK